MNFRLLVLLCCALFSALLGAQSALDRVPAYDAPFGRGLNLGWYNNWDDDNLARLALGDDETGVDGVGANALRPGLFAWFTDEFGVNIRRREFELYSRLGTSQNVAIIGFPSPRQRGNETWCAGNQSELFAGMWEPIWDPADPTDINDANTFARYLHDVVVVYGEHVRFWEIWNEPDLDVQGNGWKGRGVAGNWFENEIDPCELHIKAPVQAYVRLLRISYQVIKRLQPDDYIAIGGIGSPGFLDAVLRTTDEPVSGRTNAAYPLTGGAYFDALSFHTYPHVDGAFREWDNDRNDWQYTRNSDEAVAGFKRKLDRLRAVLEERGFDGSRYPAKVELCTETNLPQRGFNEVTAAECTAQMQRNYLLKLMAKAEAWGLAQVHPYQLAESKPRSAAGFEFEAMGMYLYIDDLDSFDGVTHTEAGEAYQTYAALLDEAGYSPALTDALALPAGADGVAFELPSGAPIFLAWAIATEDGEQATPVAYTVPQALVDAGLRLVNWDGATTGQEQPAPSTLMLGLDPVLVASEEALGVSTVHPAASATPLAVFPNPVARRLALDLPFSTAGWQVRLTNALGQSLSASLLANQELDVTALPAGVYLLTAQSGKDARSATFVKQD